jgi:hypothetical protein
MDEIKNGSEEKTTEQIYTKSQRVPRKAQHVKKLNSFHFNQNPLPYAPCSISRKLSDCARTIIIRDYNSAPPW